MQSENSWWCFFYICEKWPTLIPSVLQLLFHLFIFHLQTYREHHLLLAHCLFHYYDSIIDSFQFVFSLPISTDSALRSQIVYFIVVVFDLIFPCVIIRHFILLKILDSIGFCDSLLLQSFFCSPLTPRCMQGTGGDRTTLASTVWASAGVLCWVFGTVFLDGSRETQMDPKMSTDYKGAGIQAIKGKAGGIRYF